MASSLHPHPPPPDSRRISRWKIAIARDKPAPDARFASGNSTRGLSPASKRGMGAHPAAWTENIRGRSFLIQPSVSIRQSFPCQLDRTSTSGVGTTSRSSIHCSGQFVPRVFFALDAIVSIGWTVEPTFLSLRRAIRAAIGNESVVSDLRSQFATLDEYLGAGRITRIKYVLDSGAARRPPRSAPFPALALQTLPA